MRTLLPPTATNPRPGAVPLAVPRAIGTPCSCGHTIELDGELVKLTELIAHSRTMDTCGRRLRLSDHQIRSRLTQMRTVLMVPPRRLPQLVDTAIRWGVLDPAKVAPLGPGPLARPLLDLEILLLTLTAQGLDRAEIATKLRMPPERVARVLAEARVVLRAAGLAHAVALAHRLRLLPVGHPHEDTHPARAIDAAQVAA